MKSEKIHSELDSFRYQYSHFYYNMTPQHSVDTLHTHAHPAKTKCLLNFIAFYCNSNGTLMKRHLVMHFTHSLRKLTTSALTQLGCWLLYKGERCHCWLLTSAPTRERNLLKTNISAKLFVKVPFGTRFRQGTGEISPVSLQLTSEVTVMYVEAVIKSLWIATRDAVIS